MDKSGRLSMDDCFSGDGDDQVSTMGVSILQAQSGTVWITSNMECIECSKQTDRCMRHMHEYDGQGRGGGLWPVSTALEDVWLGNGAFHEATKKQSCRGFLPSGDGDATSPWAEEERRKKHKKMEAWSC
jgi:hypothetical protein